VPAAFVRSRTRLGLEVDTDAEDGATLRPQPTELRAHLPQLVWWERDWMPDAGQRGAPQRRSRDACNPELETARPNERRRDPTVEDDRAALVADTTWHLLKDRRGELEPLVQNSAPAFVPAAARRSPEAGVSEMQRLCAE